MVSVVLFCVQLFWWISHKPSEKYWAISPKAKHKISKKTLRTFQKCAFSAALLFCLVVAKEDCFENFLRSLFLEQYVFFVQVQSRVSAALVFERYFRYFGSLHPVFEMSCDIEYLKNCFWFFRKRGLRRFVLCAFVLMILAQTIREILGDFTESKTQTFQKVVAYVPKMSFLALLCCFFGCN